MYTTYDHYCNCGRCAKQRAKEQEILWTTSLSEQERKLEYMDTVKINIQPHNNNLVTIPAPKFKVGDKVKVTKSGDPTYYGTIDGISTGLTIFDNGKGYKSNDFQNWNYKITNENGKKYSGVAERYLELGIKPDTTKYFDFMDRCGIKLDRTIYTFKSFTQTPVFNILGNGVWNYEKINSGYSCKVVLKNTGNNEVSTFNFWANDLHRLPSLGD